MWKVLAAHVKQKGGTFPYPASLPTLAERFRGLPVLRPERCMPDCKACAEVCPTAAIEVAPALRLDLGRCLFCGACSDACPTDAVSFSREFRMATRQREHLVVSGEQQLVLAEALGEKLRRLLGRSLRLRQVSAGGCNACEADANALGTVVFDMSRFGIQFVASPRHADGLLVTGPVSRNMELALRKTYEAVPAPKLVIASGACAISGGPFVDLPQVRNGVGALLPVDLFVPGCPPHPWTLLDGLLRLLGRIRRDQPARWPMLETS